MAIDAPPVQEADVPEVSGRRPRGTVHYQIEPQSSPSSPPPIQAGTPSPGAEGPPPTQEEPRAEPAVEAPPEPKPAESPRSKPLADRLREAVFGKGDRKSTRLNSSHIQKSRMPSSA